MGHETADTTHEPETRLLRRRGLIAGAAALVAGIAAKGAATPVAAAAVTADYVVANGTAPIGVNANGTFTFGIYGQGSSVGVYGFSATGDGVDGISSSRFGVHGATIAAANSGVAGVVGVGTSAGTYGVLGVNTDGTAVQGQDGQYGVVGKVANRANTVAVYGQNESATGTNNIGVYGTSNSGYGILGVSNKPGFSGCTGAAYTAGTAGVAGGATVPGAWAAYFTGATVVQGDFTVVGGQKNAAVRHTDGSFRLLHCIESPEPWFEDFGRGQLTSGRADVKLDPDFAAVVQTDAYHVFLTGHDKAGEGLAVTAHRADGFVVEERKGGATSGTFSWRVVARRKDLGKVQRLAKFAVPQVAIPGMGDLPQVPPAAKVPEKRPERPKIP